MLFFSSWAVGSLEMAHDVSEKAVLQAHLENAKPDVWQMRVESDTFHTVVQLQVSSLVGLSV
jgi:hypothetical protein